ncbi:MAG TPA: response regulator [Steroidobacteraceae bacterium]|nr:response regulator [Steroidobacteraceae bacterium]
MAKRALVVDDSNSARTLLSRLLEKYEIEVDSAESAEQALEYLGHHRPDVIFMDHMMPGMDGLQAVRTIKDNPRTATIPIMMYTSQEGELYVGQARALGAVGVLPKQIQPADVSKVLYQLHLLPDRRSSEQHTFRRLDDDEEQRPALLPKKSLTDAGLREQFAELRRTLVALLDSHSERLKIEFQGMLEEALARPRELGARSRSAARRGSLITAIAATVAVLSLGAAAEQALERRALARELAAVRAPAAHPRASQTAGQPAAATSAADVRRAASPPAAAGGAHQPAVPARPMVEVVPYGEDPLGGPRLDALRQLFDRLVAQGYHGTVDIKIFPGRFCLMGNATEGFSLAPDETAYAQCDVVGTVPDDSMPQSQRGSLAFADLEAGLRSASHGAVDVQVETGDEASTLVAYPPVSASLTAGEWNRSGGANNRVEIRLR